MKDVITENYQLMFGDCLERMKEIPDGSVDLCVSDIPYKLTGGGKGDGANSKRYSIRQLSTNECPKV